MSHPQANDGPSCCVKVLVVLRDVTIHRATLRVQVGALVIEVRDDFTSRCIQVLVVLIEIPDDSSGSRVEVAAHIRQCIFVSVVHEGIPFGTVGPHSAA
jgi:hypothetical protein